MASPGVGDKSCTGKVVVFGGEPGRDDQWIKQCVLDYCEREGWEVRWISCPGGRLPNNVDIKNYLDGRWRILVLPLFKSTHRNRITNAAQGKGVPSVELTGYSSEELDAALEVLQQPVTGPPRGVVVAAKIVAKLMRYKKWGGNNEMNFMWWDDVPRGGFDSADEQPFVRPVAEILLQFGLLSEKPSGGERKVSLNGRRRPELEQIKRKDVRDPQLAEALGKIGR